MMLQFTDAGVIIPIKLIPKAHRDEIIGWENGELRVRITAVPEKGLANKALVRFLSRQFDIATTWITLISGATSRHKRVCIQNLSPKQIADLSSLHNKTTHPDTGQRQFDF
jgi:uncharacterized protein (TIGR00251 family)